MQSEVIDENSTFADIIPGENSLSLTINSVNWTYEGVYQCIISTENNQIEAEASLNVLSKLMLNNIIMLAIIIMKMQYNYNYSPCD